MRPEYIRMQAFGPYLQETVCDFTSLYAARLFLITGPTGGGKTTILDAMSFALYGKATGSQRDFRDMRNVATPDEIDTEVLFIFTLGEERYRFLRRFHIHKKRTGGVEEQITAECHKYQGERWELLVSGAEKVTRMAGELLGFTHSQFSQVIVLPQGEFRRLLLASSKDKLEILQVLFATSVWQQVADQAAKRLGEVKEELELLSAGRSAQLEAAGVSSAEELEAVWENCGGELAAAEAAAQQAQAAYDQASNALEAAKSLLEKFDRLAGHRRIHDGLLRQNQKIDELRRRLDSALKARSLLPYLQQKETVDQTVKQKRLAAQEADRELAAVRAAYEEISKKADGIPTLQTRIQILREKAAGISALLPEAQRLEGLTDQLAQMERDAAAAKAEAEKRAVEVRNLTDRIDKGEGYIKDLYENQILPQPQLRQELEQAENACKALVQRQEGGQAVTAAEEEKKKADGRLATALRLLEAKETIADRLERAFRENAARELAAELREGAPCPVCGATHHPAPHTGAAPAGGHDRLEETREAVRKARAQADACRSAAAEAAARLQTAQEALQQAQETCAGLSLQDLSAAEKQRDACKTRLEAAVSKAASFQRYQDGLRELKEQKQTAEAALSQAEARKNELTAGLAALTASKGDILRRLPAGADYAQLKAELQKLKEQADSLQIRTAALEKEREEKGQALSRAEAAAGAAEDACREADARRIDAERELERAVMAAGLSPDENIAGLLLEPPVIQEMETRIRQHESSLRLTADKIAELEEALVGKEQPDVSDLTARKQEAAARLSQTREERGRLAARMQQLEQARDRLAQLAQRQQGLDASYGRIARVSAFISGKNPHRTPLHGFILGLMLDEVVEAASRYLIRLSRNRYQLVRVDAVGGNALRGLDIEVTDAHTGGQRRVCTLSGGELFLASLSLAFGLAEVVQSYAGGVKLDSIFIDEGFGTLDAETLEAAMKALADIQKEGRLVGLISHVAELRDRIPAHIEVVAGQDGSSLLVKPL